MTESLYIKMTQWFKRHTAAYKMLYLIYKYLPMVFMAAYPMMLIYKAVFSLDRDILDLLIVPPCVFLSVTVMRKLINRQRPYEKFSTPSVIEKNREGCSFPSRHTASAFIIALCGYTLWLPLGIALTFLALFIGLSRILAGVHFISDVLFACVYSVLLGVVFFFII